MCQTFKQSVSNLVNRMNPVVPPTHSLCPCLKIEKLISKVNTTSQVTSPEAYHARKEKELLCNEDVIVTILQINRILSYENIETHDNARHPNISKFFSQMRMR